jgi:hypothetical protein
LGPGVPAPHQTLSGLASQGEIEMKYEVKNQMGEIVSTHKTEEAAVKKAKKMDGAVVIAHEISGTYESRMQVWPTVGECYSN